MHGILRRHAASLALLLASSALADVPARISYQGYLTSSGGTPVNAPVSMTFRLYSAPSGGLPLWSETQTVAVTNGMYSVALGSVAALALPFDTPYYLGVVVGTDAEMTPRQALTAAPFAMGIANGAVGTPQLANASVTSAKLASNGCGAGQVLRYNGSAWACASDSIVSGAAGELFAGTGSGGAWTSSPSIGGNLYLADSTPGAGNIYKGGVLFLHNYGGNTFLGYGAGNLSVNGGANTGIGQGTAVSLTSGSHNTAVGLGALQADTSGSNNSALGSNALLLNSTGASNTAMGAFAMNFNTTGNWNSAFGDSALLKNTTGYSNAAFGASALLNNTTGYYVTGIGTNALEGNTTGIANTATGTIALRMNTTGSFNTATGSSALNANTTGVANSAHGESALLANTTGGNNTATGASALRANTTGSFNTALGASSLAGNVSGAANSAFGESALYANTGSNNTASGASALRNNTTGWNSTAMGVNALQNATTGDDNIAIGFWAGTNLISGSHNIYIGNSGGNPGNPNTPGLYDSPGEQGVIRIGERKSGGLGQHIVHLAGAYGGFASAGTAVQLFTDSTDRIGTIVSSRTHKEQIEDMGAGSELLLRLRPVTFRYRGAASAEARPLQYGLIAEEVFEVAPELTALDQSGRPWTVAYHLLTPMLLNEYQKQQRLLGKQVERIAELERERERQAATLAVQERRVTELEERTRALVRVLESVAPGSGMRPALLAAPR